MGLNLRQMICSGAAIAVAVAVYLGLTPLLGHDNPVVFLPTPHGLLPMKCTPEQYEQFQRDGNKLKIKPIDHGDR